MNMLSSLSAIRVNVLIGNVYKILTELFSNLFNATSNEASAKNRNGILKSYDYLLNSKYKVTVNEKTLDRVKNYFR